LFLGSLLALASQQHTVAEGTPLLLFYGFDLGIPFVLAGLAADGALHWSRGMRKHLGVIEHVGGVVLVAMGILLFTGQLTLINIWAIRTFGLGLAL
jgi:cytochrome c-type biogenesis protein